MRQSRRPRSAIDNLGKGAVYFGILLLVWAVGSWIDLSDGKTWHYTKARYASLYEEQGRYVGGYFVYPIDARVNPKGFRMVVIFRGVMPSICMGTFFSILGLGWAAQRASLKAAGSPLKNDTQS